MLRALIIACALGLPGAALAQDFPSAVAGLDVRTDDGTVVGHIERVQRDSHGRIVSVAASRGLEPADAPYSVTDEVLSQIPRMQAPDRPSDRVADDDAARDGLGRRARVTLR